MRKLAWLQALGKTFRLRAPSNAKQKEVLMRHLPRVMLLGSLIVLSGSPVCRAQGLAQSGFWVAGELGYGSATLNSDVSSHSSRGLSMGLEGGYAFNPTISLGLRLNGCSLEASNLNDPSKGESISLFSAVVRVTRCPGRGYSCGAVPVPCATPTTIPWRSTVAAPGCALVPGTSSPFRTASASRPWWITPGGNSMM